MEWKDIIALSFGVVGTTLGIANYIKAVFDGRVRLRVTPRLTWAFKGGTLRSSSANEIGQYIKEFGVPVLAIEVLNLSKFPVTITEVGLCEGSIKRRRAAVSNPILAPDEQWPKKLDARQAVSAYFHKNALFDHELTKATIAYARTACDVTTTGNSDALRAWSAKYKTVMDTLEEHTR